MRGGVQYRPVTLCQSLGYLPLSGLRYPAEPALDKAIVVLADRCPLLRSLYLPQAALPSQASSVPFGGTFPPGEGLGGGEKCILLVGKFFVLDLLQKPV